MAFRGMNYWSVFNSLNGGIRFIYVPTEVCAKTAIQPKNEKIKLRIRTSKPSLKVKCIQELD